MTNPKGKATDISVWIGKRLVEMRATHNMTQRAAAAVMDVTFQQIQKYEKGKDRLTIERAIPLCRFLNITLDYFMPPTEDRP